MFDLGWAELLVIAGVALIVIGPKDLPQAIRTVTRLVRKLRGMAREFQSSLDDLAREAGVDEIKRDLTEFRDDYDPRAALENIADGEGELSGVFDDVTDPTTGNRIRAPEADERPDPPDLTAADFGAADETPAPPPAGATEPQPVPADTRDGDKRDGDKRDGGGA